MWDYPTIRRHSSSLSSARAIRWSSRRHHNRWWGQPLRPQRSQRRSSDSLSVSGASFRHVLSIVSGPSSLHTLGLTLLNVEPAQQQLILSIKSLRFLKLVNSTFVPTSVVMPRSSITTLWLEWLDESLVTQTKHLLTLLASSLETLRSRGLRSEVNDVIGSTQLPRLTFFEEVSSLGRSKWDHFTSFSNIKVLIIVSFGLPSVPTAMLPHMLPHLTHLSARHTVARVLLPGRPVRTYHLDVCVGSRALAKLAPCAQHVEELQLPTRMPPGELVEHLAMHLPNLVRVRLTTAKFPFPTNGKSAFVPRSGNEYVHHSLREIDIGFHRVKGRPFPSESCWNALTTLRGICPGLEVVRFGELFPVAGGGIDERNVGLDWLMDVRRTTADGEWKERKWGLS